METYNAKLISADFEESTMEFEIQHEFTVRKGDYVILHKVDYDKLVSDVEKLKEKDCVCEGGAKGRTVTPDFENRICEQCGGVEK